MTFLALVLILALVTWSAFRRPDEFRTAHQRERGMDALRRMYGKGGTR